MFLTCQVPNEPETESDAEESETETESEGDEDDEDTVSKILPAGYPGVSYYCSYIVGLTCSFPPHITNCSWICPYTTGGW